MELHKLFEQQVTDLKSNIIKAINSILSQNDIEEIELKSLIVISSNEYGNECISTYNRKTQTIETVVISNDCTDEENNDTYRLQEIELDHILRLLYEIETKNYLIG